MLFVDLFYMLRQNSHLTRQLYEIFHVLLIKTDFPVAVKTSALQLPEKKGHMQFDVILYLKMFPPLCLPMHTPREDKHLSYPPKMSISRRLSYIWLSVHFLETGHK